ncbi:hypothetical protein E1263_05435 [Kribbella antibiotica]|uniref:Uncharacterized protein n=1 Tax=Kribbella antibiotica TaxID=190195 RepID=A0A4R4ZV32_9ACTN|nr:hypothetical protein [Kribbella antibiotica]TDD62054.1 hypothetical protein E1263_05435 [Kribbella antibiotica]
MRDPLQRLYQTKLALLAVIFVVVGAGLLVVVHWPGLLPAWTSGLPLTDLGSALFTTGLVVIAFEYVDGRDSEERADARLRATIRSEAPAIREAVIRGFAVESDDLKRVATPELLDQIAENSIGLRFGDRDFAREVYSDIRDQAIKAEERWYDAKVQIDIGVPSDPGPVRVPLFDVTVRWEYTVVPHHRFRRFAAVSDGARYDELASQSGDTSVWFHGPVEGLVATDPSAFSLQRFTVDGHARQITRTEDATVQIYAVDVGAEVVADAQPVVVSFTFTTRIAQAGHVLRFDTDRPTRGLAVEMNYDDAGISRMRMFDYTAPGARRPLIDESASPTGQRLRFSHDGWLFPRSGLLFTWTLDREIALALKPGQHNARQGKTLDGRAHEPSARS